MTGKYSAEKGKRWERAVVRYWNTRSKRQVTRLKAGRFSDRGDLGLPDSDTLFDCKDYKVWHIAKWIAEGLGKLQAGEKLALILKRSRRPVGQALVIKVMTLDQLIDEENDVE